MTPFVHLVADYGPGDPAFAEVIHRLRAAEPRLTVEPTSVPPFSTIATGFWIEQLGVHNPAFDGLTIYSNTAPRMDDERPRAANEGEALVYLELDNGVPVLAIDAGYNLSFVREQVRIARSVNIPQRGSQFRSRDFYPTVVAAVATGDTSSLGDRLSLDTVPPAPTHRVCHVDGYGNLKTGIRSSNVDLDREAVRITIGDVTREATIVETAFAVAQGQLAMTPGSAGGDDPYMEVFQRGGNAATTFGEPAPGSEIAIEAP